MIAIIVFILLILAAICFLAAAANREAKVNLVALGLLLWVVTVLIHAAPAIH